MNYRFAGKQKTIAFGNYPDLPLAKARDMLASAREAPAEGMDPREVRRQKARAERDMSADLKGALITPKPAIAKLAEKSRSVYVSLAVLRRRAEFDIG